MGRAEGGGEEQSGKRVEKRWHEKKRAGEEEKREKKKDKFFFFKQKTAYEIKECDWSSDVCSSDLKANEFGLYDMLGNVWEWCNDWYGKEFSKYPFGADNGIERLLRGGSWMDFANNIRSVYRNRKDPFDRDKTQGFRLVLPSSHKSADEL